MPGGGGERTDYGELVVYHEENSKVPHEGGKNRGERAKNDAETFQSTQRPE